MAISSFGLAPSEATASDSDASGLFDALDSAAIEAFEKSYPPATAAPLAVVIAAYNEQNSVGKAVADIPSEICGMSVDVIVVVDGSSDGTASEALSAGAKVCNVPVNRGQGAALRLGYRLARRRNAQVIVTTDADGQYDPDDMAGVVRPILEDKADFVSGSRRLGIALTSDRVRSTGVIAFSVLISVLIKHRITDPACGLRAMRAELTADVVLTQPQYQASELLIGAAMRGFRLAEAPITMLARSAGSTKKGNNARYAWRFSSVVLGTWWRERRGSAKTNSSYTKNFAPQRRTIEAR